MTAAETKAGEGAALPEARYASVGRCKFGCMVMACIDRHDQSTAEAVSEGILSGLAVDRIPLEQLQVSAETFGCQKKCVPVGSCPAFEGFPLAKEDGDEDTEVDRLYPEDTAEPVSPKFTDAYPRLALVLNSLTSQDGVFDQNDLIRAMTEAGAWL